MKTIDDFYESIKRKFENPLRDYEERCESLASLIRKEEWWNWARHYEFCKQFRYLQEIQGIPFVTLDYEGKLEAVQKYLMMPVCEHMSEGVAEFHESFIPKNEQWFFEEVEMYREAMRKRL